MVWQIEYTSQSGVEMYQVDGTMVVLEVFHEPCCNLQSFRSWLACYLLLQSFPFNFIICIFPCID